jgi:hypothetical protein
MDDILNMAAGEAVCEALMIVGRCDLGDLKNYKVTRASLYQAGHCLRRALNKDCGFVLIHDLLLQMVAIPAEIENTDLFDGSVIFADILNVLRNKAEIWMPQDCLISALSQPYVLCADVAKEVDSWPEDRKALIGDLARAVLAATSQPVSTNAVSGELGWQLTHDSLCDPGKKAGHMIARDGTPISISSAMAGDCRVITSSAFWPPKVSRMPEP